MFQPAVKTESKLRMAIAGPSGSGKTYTALSVAAALVPGGKVAVIDTEHGSAAKYADLFTFDVANAAPPYHPDGLIKLVTFAANSGYDVVIVDSTSHYWNGAGGILDIKDDIERKMRNPNSYTSWKDVTPIHQRMVDTLVGVNAHVIVTMRSKQDYVLVEKNGKQVPQKVGMAPVQRDGFEYEFDVMLDMDIKNVGHVTKTRCPALTDVDFVKPGADLAAILREWLTGAAPEQAPPPVVFTPQAPPAPVKPAAQPAAVDPVATFVARVQSSPAVAAISFKNGRLTDWVNFVTGGKFDPAHADYLAEVLDRYCGAVADNGNAHTKAAAEKAKADYEAGIFVLSGQREGFIDADSPERMEAQAALDLENTDAERAGLATALGQMD
jgi:hypothetical protein